MIRRRTITSYVWNSVSGNKMVILSNCIRNFFRKFELLGNSTQGENPAPDNPQEIKSVGKWNEEKQKYEIDVKVTGKNLIKTSPILPKRWSNNIDNHVIKYITLKPHTTYTLAMEEDTNYVNDLRVRIFSKNDMTRWLVELLGSSENKKKFTTKDDAECVLCVYHLLDYKGDVKQLQLVEGDTSTPYQPYTEQFAKIALDEPLRGIGEYKDTITKDGVVRKIKRIVFDGSEDEKWGLSREHENHINFALVIKGAITVNTGIRTMMDKFKYFGAIWNSDLLGQDMFGATLRINMPKILATDLQTFKTWLSQNPLTVDYVLAESVTEPLPESVQAQLSSLHSKNGTTHVFVDSGEVEAGINIEYKYKS